MIYLLTHCGKWDGCVYIVYMLQILSYYVRFLQICVRYVCACERSAMCRCLSSHIDYIIQRSLSHTDTFVEADSSSAYRVCRIHTLHIMLHFNTKNDGLLYRFAFEIKSHT